MDSGEKKEYRKVLFSDLDGTLITPFNDREFPIGCYDMKPRFDTLNSILNYKPDLVIIISNQGGIEAGYVNPNFFRNKILWVSSIVAEYCHCDCRVEYCPSIDENNVRRKPHPGMIFDAMDKLQEDISNVDFLMIGDRQEDVSCAANANIPYIDVEKFIQEYENLN